MTFADSIRASADVLDELNAHMQFGDKATWNSSELRHVAKAVEKEEMETAEREILEGALAQELHCAAFNDGLSQENVYRRMAQALLKSGWRKVDTA